MGDVGRALAQHHHAELFLLRAVEADRHVVLGALLGQKHLHHPVEMTLGQGEMMGEEAFIGGGISEIGIDREQIVQERGAGAPMADDEDRRLIEGKRLGALSIFRFGEPIEHRIPRHPEEERQRVGDAVEREAVAAAVEQLHQGAEAHAEPEIDQPSAIALDGERGHPRLGAAASRKLAGFVRRHDFVIRHAGTPTGRWIGSGFDARL